MSVISSTMSYRLASHRSTRTSKVMVFQKKDDQSIIQNITADTNMSHWNV